MLYRVLIGAIPTILFSLVLTGAIPVSGLLPTGGSGSAPTADGKGYRARTPEGVVSQRLGLLPSGAVEMMEDNMRATDQLLEVAERSKEDRRRGINRAEWEARGGGWGRPQR